ncbi:MAG: crossover junction endodeoxyribonuclease RuvC [Candidatus Aquirickettsiella gammari]|jgi:crossover junction endodeoxyribonuclease RuvC|uniref:Crossover junction endodeoxyribonuclease RuvC n=1 Tax=Candidatus Aquirickettsiella gammari TaxID=2016198 RepID=A0A370CL16_9COXI|nr:MAG: crossover junction endodeoxyribonuclease RuvC [Candidatus Aquirickettsiella gammari]
MMHYRLNKPILAAEKSIILGIDPGSCITGYGLIQIESSQLTYLDSGCIKVANSPFAERLEKIFTGLQQVVNQYQPSEVAIEQVFFHINPNAALKLGQARGAALVAVACAKLLVSEYSARQVKKSVVGYGAANKQQVQHMVRVLLNLSSTPTADAADALAIAVCHAQVRQSGGIRLGFRRGRRR